eukprot:CAMPEP_0195541324 /NCGR_PEP_ID=MMETSP0794_2-20130614/51031_1 /TAXON_ID=515487 /ORGANISM="Stephanopyxis turris, Strain CCMP 815" /LENGTH=232 /DNA_ID=CAMNT_0040675419 /DNA_START=93 /DNA_END=791 /DNA_ORIENTATION=+
MENNLSQHRHKQESSSNDTLFHHNHEMTNEASHNSEVEKGSFQIKMHWEEGIVWQGSTAKKSWCMQCGYICAEGEFVQVQKCKQNEVKQKWIYDNSTGNIRSGVNMESCVSYFKATDEIRRVKLVNCSKDENHKEQNGSNHEDNMNDNDDKQIDKYQSQWSAISRNSTFQLHPKTDESKCLTQTHHPKNREDLKLYPCSIARNNDEGVHDDTSQWVIGTFDGHRRILKDDLL